MRIRRQVTYSQKPTRAARHAHARGERQFRTYDTSLIAPKRRYTPQLIVLAVVALLMALGIGYNVYSCARPVPVEVVEQGTVVSINVPDGASTSQIATLLQENRLIGLPSDFTEVVKREGVDVQLKPGTYQFEGGTSVEEIVNRLVAGPNVYSVAIPEGYTIARTAQAVETSTEGQITASDFEAAAQNASAFAGEFPFVSEAYNNSLEGFLFPKTYQVSVTDTADTLIQDMLSQYQQEVSSLDYSYATAAGLSAYDVVRLASVVEREADDTTRPTVASVFYNRLADNMALQSDATIAYVVGHDPKPADLSVSSPYNTYTNKGLPAGPICSPGLSSLQATCAPESTDYLYFYFTQNTDGSLNYYFSQTYDQHKDAINSTNESSSTASSGA